jgi:hypothetical protein
MTIPPDSDMISIEKIPFSDGAIEIGRFKDEGKIVTVMRKQGDVWFHSTADAQLRIHYLRNNLTVDQAWESLKGYLK